jgi:hypothetical protein
MMHRDLKPGNIHDLKVGCQAPRLRSGKSGSFPGVGSNSDRRGGQPRVLFRRVPAEKREQAVQ